ncbi:MAG: hypothetical protein A2234_00755 [Elusimicrobia bacterium RIFOXYA2_FULL_58_8]|nr:MAG: hypothetical protein A2234_00755 [Elusimicrobia bacterium RIFOXYA2_FULL_58_8]
MVFSAACFAGEPECTSDVKWKKNLIDSFTHTNGGGIMLCGYEKEKQLVIAKDGVKVHTISNFDVVSFTKDGKTQVLASDMDENFIDSVFLAWVEKDKGLKIEMRTLLPVRSKGKEWQSVALSQWSSVCGSDGCKITEAACVLDTSGWELAEGIVEQARKYAAPRGTRIHALKVAPVEELPSHLLAGALSGNLTAAYYLMEFEKFYSSDGAYGEALSIDQTILSHARAIRCVGVR